ncbi:MAG: AAA family ATPase [Proteobacteria bacterium]|nr:AAA family ATPase [Pseudomonadota bacterium]
MTCAARWKLKPVPGRLSTSGARACTALPSRDNAVTQKNLLLDEGPAYVPLADRLRPKSLAEVVGQDHVLGDGGFITRCVRAGKPASIVLWGPPGCGKTTLARLYAQAFGARFIQLSAVFSGVKDLRAAVEEAAAHRSQQATVLFVDEIHRFNKAQQDAFLPYVEDGTVILVGATTENPSFELNNALLSRVQVLTLKELTVSALDTLLARAEAVMGPMPVTEDGRAALVGMANGDGRYLLGLVEAVYHIAPEEQLSADDLNKLLSQKSALYDRAGEGHYNLISALHKSVRGSDPDASLYWFCRMLEGGEDPLFIARRLIRMASEDIGLADPQALPQCIAARDAYHTLGSPEGELMLAQAVIYLALAPKSNATYTAYKAARKAAEQSGEMNPPKVILNAPTKLMKSEGYGDGYQYDHDTPHAFSGQNYFPDGMRRPRFYQPVERGFERDMGKRVQYFDKLRKELNKSK